MTCPDRYFVACRFAEIDASRRAALLDHACDTESELGNEKGGLRESDKTPGRLKQPDRPDAEPRVRQAFEIFKRKLSQSAPVAAPEIQLA
jgi:hypothetical protein